MEWNGRVEYWTGLLQCHAHYIGNLSIVCLVSFPDPTLMEGKGLLHVHQASDFWGLLLNSVALIRFMSCGLHVIIV